jgi:hypothetical protein
LCYRHYLLLIAGVLIFSPGLWGQELEPRAYLITPVGTNAVLLTNEFDTGGVLFDPTLPLEGVHGNINTTAFSYYRSLSFFGRSANFTLTAPYRFGTISGQVLGQEAQAYRSGMASPGIRFAWNLYGGPAMDRKEFASFRQGRSLGFSIKAISPLGQYYPDRFVNISTNRWSIKPEFGLILPLGNRRRWFAELDGGVWLFTANNDYLGGGTREQAPIGSLQFHLIRVLQRKAWVAFDTNVYYGGQTTINGVGRSDLQKDSRVGGTLGYVIDRRQSLRVTVSAAAYTTIGQKFTSFSIGYQYAWIGRR